MLNSFIFNADDPGSYEDLQRRRKMAEALQSSVAGDQPRDVPSGILTLAKALKARMDLSAVGKAEKGINAGNSSAFERLLAGLGRGQGGQTGGAALPPPAMPEAPVEAPQPGLSSPMLGGEPRKTYPAPDTGPYANDPVKMALLNAIAGRESAGDYNVIYGGRRVTDLSRHPGIATPIRSGPNKGKTSSAAGKYQFLGQTWEQYAGKLGLKDFSPASQDKAAWALASDVYRQKTGRDLGKDAESGDPQRIASIGKALSGTWTSLPSGIEQGQGTNEFIRRVLGAQRKPAQTDMAGGQQMLGTSGMDMLQGGAGADQLNPAVEPQFPTAQPQGQTEFQRMMAHSQEKLGGSPMMGMPQPQAQPQVMAQAQPDMSEVVADPEAEFASRMKAGKFSADEVPQTDRPFQGQDTGQPGTPTIQEILQFMARPGLNDQQREIGKYMLERAISEGNPNTALKRRMNEQTLKQAELDYQQDANPQADPIKVIDLKIKQLEFMKAQAGDPKEQVQLQILQNELEQKKVELEAKRTGSGSEAGLNLFYSKDADGKLHAYQPLRNGGSMEVKLPDGQEFAPQLQYLDAGTTFIPAGRRGEKIDLPAIPKDVAGEAGQKEIGKQIGDAKAGIGGAEAKVRNAISEVDAILNHPGLPGGTGTWQGLVPDSVAGIFDSDVADFRSRVSQLQGGAFLQAYETLKGGGAIANAEGEKATQAIARARTAVKEEDFKRAMKEYRSAIIRGFNAMQKKAGGGQPQAQPEPPVEQKSDPLIDNMFSDPVDAQALPKAALNPANLKRPEGIDPADWDLMTAEERRQWILEMSR